MNSHNAYLISSFLNNPDRFFQGYCFVGADYIGGAEGAENFENRTGQTIRPGEDGCYIVSKKNGSNYEIGADQAGYKKIFYYYNSATKVWAVSNSIILIHDHLKEQGISVTPNYALIKNFKFSKRKNFTQQLVSFDTIVNEIKLLPANHQLCIKEGLLEIVKNQVNQSASSKNYAALLKDFVECWVSRFVTLLSNDSMTINQDLTGGLDSRAIFSLYYLAQKYLNKKVDADHYIVSKLTRGDEIDIKVAQEICNNYNCKLNDENRLKSLYQPLNNIDNYQLWKSLNVGIYQPIYFPTYHVNYQRVRFNGGGGENHRPFYAKNCKPNNPKRFNLYINQFVKDIHPEYLGSELEDSLNNSINYLMGLSENKDQEKLNVHYKNFRNRIHCGLNPQYMVCFTPLSSVLLDSIASNGYLDKIRSSQILYDIINLTPGLLSVEFDKPSKEPNLQNLNELISFESELDINCGDVYISSNDSLNKSSSDSNNISPIEILKEEFDIACESEFVNKVWDEDFISQAKIDMEKAIKLKRFSHGLDGAYVSAIIATNLFHN